MGGVRSPCQWEARDGLRVERIPGRQAGGRQELCLVVVSDVMGLGNVGHVLCWNPDLHPLGWTWPARGPEEGLVPSGPSHSASRIFLPDSHPRLLSLLQIRQAHCFLLAVPTAWTAFPSGLHQVTSPSWSQLTCQLLRPASPTQPTHSLPRGSLPEPASVASWPAPKPEICTVYVWPPTPQPTGGQLLGVGTSSVCTPSSPAQRLACSGHLVGLLAE